MKINNQGGVDINGGLKNRNHTYFDERILNSVDLTEQTSKETLHLA